MSTVISSPRTLKGPAGVVVMGAAVIALALPLTHRWEGEVPYGYRDLGGVVTSCSGHTKTAVLAQRYTPAQCSALLAQDLQEHADMIRPCIPAATPLPTQAAFLDLAFNIGGRATCRSTAVRKLKAGDLAGACDALMSWVLVNGRRVQGLVNRRSEDRALCRQGLVPPPAVIAP